MRFAERAEDRWAKNREGSFLFALNRFNTTLFDGNNKLTRGLEISLNGICKDIWGIGREKVSKKVWDAAFNYKMRNCEPTYS